MNAKLKQKQELIFAHSHLLQFCFVLNVKPAFV